MLRRFSPAVLAAVALNSAAARPQDDLVLRSTTRLVHVDVVAHDKSGQPVRDLTREDFILTDNGRPQPISFFSMDVAESVLSGEESAVSAHPLTIANRAVHANGKPIPVTVILFDALNIDQVDDFPYAKRELLKFLRTLHRGDPVALYSLSGPAVRVIHDFTDDADSLIESAQRLAGVQILKGAGSDAPARVRIRAGWTMSALENIAGHLSGVPGRKSLIWISGSFPITIGLSTEAFAAAERAGVNQDLFSYSDRATRIARLLANAQVAIYPIDPAGLSTDTVYRASMSGSDAAGQISLPRMISAGEREEPFLRSMDLLAQETGGLAFYHANNLSAEIREAVNDARITYTLGFYPAETAWDGKYHVLKVTARRGEIQLRSRSGYVAVTPSVQAPPERERLLRLAAASPLEGVAIGLKVNTVSNPLEWWGQELVLVIDPHDIRFEEKGDRMLADVDVAFVQQTSAGRTIKGEKKAINFALSPESYETALAQGLFVTEQITVEPRASRVRIVVLDASTGAAGSVSIPVGPRK